MLKVCVFTGARSEYGLLRRVMRELHSRTQFQLQVIATGSHLSEKHGFTYREIEADGFSIDEKVPINLESDLAPLLVEAVGELTVGLSRALSKLKPDLILFMGDRYELLALIAAAVILTIPLAHISGGEVTEGAIDDVVRHAATKASHLHFVANDTFARRVLQMGEERWRVATTGDPGLDEINDLEYLEREELCLTCGMKATPKVGLVSYHPTTLDAKNLTDQISALCGAMDRMYRDCGVRYLITYPNADAGSDIIIGAFKRFVAEHLDCALIPNLGRLKYLSALRSFDFVIGNSSSALFEAPAFNTPAVNVGLRQAGRLRANNVFDVAGDLASILNGIRSALAYDRKSRITNPYGDGNASCKIVDQIGLMFRSRGREAILRKKFIDIL